LASTIDSSEDAFLSKDLNGTITNWNRGAEHIYGYTSEEAIGKHISLLTARDGAGEISEILGKIVRGAVIEHHESVRVTKDRRHLNVSISVFPLRDATALLSCSMILLRSLMSRIALRTIIPSSFVTGLRLISTGNSEPFRRLP
jgi:PAS domain S-box-containing protein